MQSASGKTLTKAGRRGRFMPDQVEWRATEHDTTGHAVGRLLREQREERGITIEEVAKSLRIRSAFLKAIEQGRFEELPGAAYIPAFLRGYASYLGLDAQKVLTAYQLSGSLPVVRPVSLPANFPLAERRAPVGLAVLTVLLVVAAGYAVWHYLPQQQEVVAEKVPPVPDRLLAERPAKSDSSTSETAHLATAPAVVTPSQVQSKVRAAAPAPMQAGVPAASGPPPEIPLVPPPAVIAVPAAPPPVIVTAPAAGQALAAQPPAIETQSNPPAVDPQEAVVRPPPPASTDSAMVVATPTKSDTRVIVRSNSWVELRSPNGDVLAQTYVRAGESYTVPAGIAYRIIEAR
ncbi:helix-turn-helix domain-containing protein [Reyranella sp.]|uniref:helix-turn-helix domain-containing protein n=1 Tax=Reyranella sp. TaxID=1929291 RepID=UPI002F92B81A